jgi:hypothetical protein
MGRRLAQHVADMDLFFPMLERLGGLAAADETDSLEITAADVRSFANRGKGMRSAMHDAAHNGALGSYSPLPSLSELNVWRNQATQLTVALGVIDTSWYVDYWTGVFGSGVKLPRALKSQLRRQGVRV